MSIYQGIKYNIQGVSLALKTPRLLVLGILRFAVVLALALVFSGLVLYWHADILNLIWKMPESGILVYVWTVVSWLVSLFLAGIAMVVAYLVAQILFCVFIMDYMSRITEQIITGSDEAFEPDSWIWFFFYLIRQEIPRAVLPVLITLVVMILGLLTPLGPVVVIVSSVVAGVFLAWDNTDLTPARHMLTFKDRMTFLTSNIGFHIGFGLLFLIPWLNIIFLSFAPVGATLYYLQQTKPGENF